MWTFGRKMGLGFALSFAMLLLVGALSYQGVETLTRTSYRVAHTHEVLDHTNGLLSELKDAETGQRGFMLSGADEYLEPYVKAQAAIPRLLTELRQLIADNPRQLLRTQEAADRVEIIMKLHQARIDQRRKPGADANTPAVQPGEGKRQMDALRRLLGEMESEERSLLSVRAAEDESAAHGVRIAITFGTLAGLILVVGAATLLARTLKAQIGAAVAHVQRTSAELQTVSAQQAAGARETATSMTEITTTLAELMSTSRQIAESAKRVVNIADKTAGAARSGDGILTAAGDSISGIRQQTGLVVDHMLDLGRKTQQIGAVLELVAELADQTNILAINATIEASGAGEAGKRFGVVADEVRKLADRMAASTKEIRAQIDEVRSAANSTVLVTESGSKSVEAGARRFGDVTASFSEIGGLVLMTNEAAREIELSTLQQATAVEQLNSALAHTTRAARETETSSAQMSQSAAQLALMSRGLVRLVQTQPAS